MEAENNKKQAKFAVYSGRNVASGEPIVRIKQSFNEAAVGKVTGAQIREEDALDDDTIALFLPGITNDNSPYYEEIGEDGNKKIREYVENGGVFLGGCAGAYYACADILYDPPWLDQPKTSQPGLNFFNGIAHGPVPHHAKETGSPDWSVDCTHAEIEFTGEDNKKKTTDIIYGNGPMYYPDKNEEEQLNIIARYNTMEGKPVAIATKQVGKGLAIFLGVLPYYGTDLYEGMKMADSQQEFLDSIAPYEQDRKEIWDMVINIIKEHREKVVQNRELEQSSKPLGSKTLGNKPQF